MISNSIFFEDSEARPALRATLHPFIHQRSYSIPVFRSCWLIPLPSVQTTTPLTAVSLSEAQRRRNCFHNINTSDNLARLCFPCRYAGLAVIPRIVSGYNGRLSLSVRCLPLSHCVVRLRTLRARVLVVCWSTVSRRTLLPPVRDILTFDTILRYVLTRST